MSTATATAPAANSALNPKLILPFVASVKSVCQTMLSLEVTFERPRMKGKPGAEYDCTGIIAFSGSILGSVVVGFNFDAAARLVERFAGVPVEPRTADFGDALGELTNMIVGGAKKDLGAGASISVPTVVMGRGHTVGRPTEVPTLVVPCVTELGAFAVEISIAAV